MLITGTSNIPNRVEGYYSRELLLRAQPALVYDLFGETRPLPKNAGDRINVRRYEKLATNTTPLDEAITPTGKLLTVTDLYITAYQYGDLVYVSDWLETTGLDPNIMGIAGEVLNEQMGESIDLVYRDNLVAGTSIRYANGVSSRTSVVSKIVDDDIDSITRTLEGNNTRKVTGMKKASTGIGTAPIRPAYIGITHPDSRKDIEALTSFISVEEESSRDSLSSYMGDIIEIGTTRNIRWLATTQCKIWTSSGGSVGQTGLKSTDDSNIDVYGTIIFGRKSYVKTPLVASKNVRVIVKATDSGGAENGLNQRGSVGWKVSTGIGIINEDNLIRLEHGVTDL